jgi:MFS superfamily sulfate permease-like transporter
MPDGTQQRGTHSLLPAFSGSSWQTLAADLGAGLTLAAIAVPEQMATARLGGFAPELGLFVFVAGTAAFTLFGANRYLSSGADSTITPIFAGTLGLLAQQGSPAYLSLAAALALAVGVVMIAGGLARLGWVANFLSRPVATGFMAGIAVHIAISQFPTLLGLDTPAGDLVSRCIWIGTHLAQTNVYALALGGLVFGLSMAGEKLPWRIPGALIGLGVAMLLVAFLGNRGAAVVGATAIAWPHPALPAIAGGNLGSLAELALIVAIVVMVQTAATTRAFTTLSEPRNVNRDFIGVGAGSVVAGLFGLFPVNASPPRTAAVQQSGGKTQVAGLFAVLFVALLLVFGASLLRFVAYAALAGVLLAVALRLVNVSEFLLVWRESRAEFALILATVAAIVALPIQSGVAVGIGLSVLHGLWTITRTHMIELVNVPGTTIWWPPMPDQPGETRADVRVVAFQAPLFFLNADDFRRDMIRTIEGDRPTLIVFEASGVAEIDFTAAQTLLEIIARCRKAGIHFAVARLTSLRAQQALQRFGVDAALGPQGVFRSVDEAIRALCPPK